VTKRVIDLLKVVDIHHEDGDLVLFLLGVANGGLESHLKKLAVGESGELIVIGQETGLIGDAPAFGNIAAGDGEPAAEFDRVDMQPGGADAVVVEEDLSSIGNAGADDLLIAADETRGDGEGAYFGERAAEKGFAGGTQATLGHRIDVSKAEINDVSGRVRNAGEEIHIVDAVFSGAAKVQLFVVGVVGCGGTEKRGIDVGRDQSGHSRADDLNPRAMGNGEKWDEDKLQAEEDRKAKQDATEDLHRAELWPGVVHLSSLDSQIRANDAAARHNTEGE